MGDKNKSFTIDYKLLPPKLQVKLWVLALDADTSKVNISYRRSEFRTSLTYNFGGNREAPLSIRKYSSMLGDHTLGGLDLGLTYRGFRFGGSANFTQPAYGVSFGYGAKLLPIPVQLASSFNAAGAAALSVASNGHQAINNPLAWYKMHSNDIGAISEGVSVGKKIAEQNEVLPWGVGVGLNYTPEGGFMIFGGFQKLFF